MSILDQHGRPIESRPSMISWFVRNWKVVSSSSLAALALIATMLVNFKTIHDFFFPEQKHSILKIENLRYNSEYNGVDLIVKNSGNELATLTSIRVSLVSRIDLTDATRLTHSLDLLDSEGSTEQFPLKIRKNSDLFTFNPNNLTVEKSVLVQIARAIKPGTADRFILRHLVEFSLGADRIIDIVRIELIHDGGQKTDAGCFAYERFDVNDYSWNPNTESFQVFREEIDTHFALKTTGIQQIISVHAAKQN